MIKVALGKDLWVRPQIECVKEFHGSSYGGWTVCPNGLGPKSIVYSFGVGDDITFDLSLIQKYGVQVFAFDPTPRSIQWIQNQKLPAQFHFQGLGLGDRDDSSVFFAPKDPRHMSFSAVRSSVTSGEAQSFPIRRLETLARSLQHDQLSILKMDIEGMEYEVLEDILRCPLKPRQILIEFHHRHHPQGAKATRGAIGQLNAAGYKLFHVSERGEEFSFIQEATA
jgi:FkbM family methyltransferase